MQNILHIVKHKQVRYKFICIKKNNFNKFSITFNKVMLQLCVVKKNAFPSTEKYVERYLDVHKYFTDLLMS